MATDVSLETGGTVWKVLVTEGESVQQGQELFIMEVMKMEVPYEAPVKGVISNLAIGEGDVVEEGHVALTVT